MSALIGHAKALRALAEGFLEQAKFAAEYPDEKANSVPDILHRTGLAHLAAADRLEAQAKDEASG